MAVLVEKKIYLALITDIDSEEEEADLMLLHPPLPATNFTWSENSCGYVAPLPHIIAKVSVAEAGTAYSISKKEVSRLKNIAKLRRKSLKTH